MTLREIDSNIEALIDPDTGEVTDIDALERLAEARDKKCENIALLIIQKQADVDMRSGEINRLEAENNKDERTIDNLKAYLLEALGGAKMKTPLVSVSYRTSHPVEIVDADEIPAEYMRVPAPQPNKSAISAAIRAGEEIPGARLTEKTNVIIK